MSLFVRFFAAAMCGPVTLVNIARFLLKFSNSSSGFPSYGPKTFRKEIFSSCIEKNVFEISGPMSFVNISMYCLKLCEE
jgi:hypothetical protein